MTYDLVLRNGTVVTETSVLEGASIAIEDGTIVGIGDDASVEKGSREIDIEGKIALPGMIDPHVHFGTGDQSDLDTQVVDFGINSKDALIGGVTTICTTTLFGGASLEELFEQTLTAGRDRSFCNFRIDSVVTTRDQVDEIPHLVSRGVRGFKFFAGYVGEQAQGLGMSPDGIPPDMFYEACEQIKKGGGGAFAKIHAEEPTVRGLLVDRMRDIDEAASLVKWAETTPNWAESAQIFTYGRIAEQLGVPFYPVHVSTAETLDTVRWMTAGGANMTVESLALYLVSTASEMDAKGMGGKAKIQPPLRHAHDRDALWGAIQDGTISVLGTDSTTYSARYKADTDFWDCRVGVNLQLADTIPLLFTEGVQKGKITLQHLAELVATNAAKLYGMYPRKGSLAVGSDADIAIIDPERTVTLGVDRLVGNTDYSLWEGRDVVGAPVLTVLNGAVVAEGGSVVTAQPSGQYTQ